MRLGSSKLDAALFFCQRLVDDHVDPTRKCLLLTCEEEFGGLRLHSQGQEDKCYARIRRYAFSVDAFTIR